MRRLFPPACERWEQIEMVRLGSRGRRSPLYFYSISGQKSKFLPEYLPHSPSPKNHKQKIHVRFRRQKEKIQASRYKGEWSPARPVSPFEKWYNIFASLGSCSKISPELSSPKYPPYWAQPETPHYCCARCWIRWAVSAPFYLCSKRAEPFTYLMVWLGSFLVWTVTTVYACWIILCHVRRRSTRAKELRRELFEWQTAARLSTAE